MREAEHFRPRNSKCEGPEVKLRERRSKTALRVAGGKGARKRRAGFVVRPDHNEPWKSLALTKANRKEPLKDSEQDDE